MSAKATRKQIRLTRRSMVVGKEYPEVFDDRDTAGGKFTFGIGFPNREPGQDSS